MNKKILSKIIVGITVLIFTACSSVPRFTSSKANRTKQPEEKPIAENNDLNSYNDFTVLETVTGVASYYADQFNGKLTSNGETYDMYGLTAAHPSYPHNTIIRVTNLNNNKSVIIRVNDRMPKRPDRIIDLSYGTAQALSMVASGLAKVKLEILKWGED